MEDLERFRHRWESDEHWSMRREFILLHRGRFSENRLLGLAQAFANMEILGCMYPAAVTEFVRKLAKDVPRPARPSVPRFALVNFAKSSATPPHGLSSETPVQSFVSDVEIEAGVACEPRKRGASPDATDSCIVAKVARMSADEQPAKAASASSQSTVDITDATRLSKFQAVTRLIKDEVITGLDGLDVMQQAFSQCGFKLKFEVRQSVECVIRADGETLAVASAPSKKKAKSLALKSIWEKFASICPSLPKDVHMPHESKKIDKGVKKGCVKGKRARLSLPLKRSKAAKKRNAKSKRIFQSSVPRNADVSTKRKCVAKGTEEGGERSKPTGQSSAVSGFLDLEKLVVVEGTKSPCDVMSTLAMTARQNRLKARFDLQSTGSGFVCTYTLGQHIIKEGRGATKQEAKRKAASASLAYLQSVAPTLRIKQLADGVGPKLTRDMFGGPEEISEENIGHRLLKMMGWTGGGMGKGGSGIVDPVVLKETCGRHGLGFGSECSPQVDKNFSDKIHQVLQEYSRAVVLEDLVFSPEFSKEERQYIHATATKFRLRSVSVNSPSGRCLTVGHRIPAREIVDKILASGQTEKYELVMPGETSVPVTGTLGQTSDEKK